MSNTATILVKRRSGMTRAALALAIGLEACGQRVHLVVPTMSDVINIHSNNFNGQIVAAESVHDMTRSTPDVYVFDDAHRCELEFERCREGDLLKIVNERLSTYHDGLTRIFLFRYAL